MSNAVEHPKKIEGFNSFAEFYPFYLREHSNSICRGLHYVGSTLGLIIAGYALYTENYRYLIPAIICGYLFAWVGHIFFEHNRPATFKHPFYSFLGDWVMLKDFSTGQFRRK